MCRADRMDERLSDRSSESQAEGEERPTLKTIARIAGLAVPTISRALNDAPDIGEDTKRRVRDIATRIGYRPNRAGLRLRTGKTQVISLVLSTQTDLMDHTARLVSSLAGALRGTPYHLIITPYFPDEDPLAPVKYIVESGSADGIVMNQIEPRDRRVAYLLEREFPFATHGRTVWTHAWADYDNAAYARIAVDQLVRRGRQRIGLLLPPLSQNYAQNLREGATEAAARLGAELVLIAGATSDSPREALIPVMQRYVAGPDACDGFIIPNASAVMAAVNVAEDAGLVLGRDFDLAAKEASPFLRSFRRGILSCHEDVTGVAQFLARAVMHRIARPDEAPMQYLDVPSADWDREA